MEKHDPEMPEAKLDTSEDALKLVKEVKKELGEYRKPFENDWRKYDNAYYGSQHKIGQTSENKTTKNHIFKIIEGEIPVLTDSMPGTQITASTEQMQQSADNLGKAIKYTYQDQNLQLLLPSLLRSALTSAPGYLYASYNQDADGGDGKIEDRQLPWKSIFLDGNAQTIEQAEKCRIEIPTRRESLARTWPEKYKEIMGIKGQSSDTDGNSSDDNFEARDVSGRDSEVGKPKTHKAKDIVLYVETWVKSYDLIDIEAEETAEQLKEETEQLKGSQAPDITKWQNHDAHIEAHKALRGELLAVVGLPPDASFEDAQAHVSQLMEQNPDAADLKTGLLALKIIDNHIEEHEELKKLNPTGQEPKYEDGWRVIKSVENVVLYDGPNPENNGLIPLVPFYCYKDDTIYGFGEVKNIYSPQQTLNDMDFRELEGLRLCSNPGWIADHEAFEEDEDGSSLTNAPGIVVLKKKGTEVRRLEPGSISPQLEQRKTLDQQAMESIAGQNEQTMNGAMPQGNASGTMVEKIQTQAVGRIRLKGRGLEYYSMRRLALIHGSLIINHWTQEKRLRLRSDDNTIEEIIYNPLEMENLDYIVDVSPGSMAGVDKDSLIAFYMTLLNNQHIDFDMFLSACPEFPGKHVLVKKLKEKDQSQAQIQQAQQQYEQTIQQLQAQGQQLQEQNIKLKGAMDLGRQASTELLNGDEKKVFSQISKENEINNLVKPEELQMGNSEPMMANQNNQG